MFLGASSGQRSRAYVRRVFVPGKPRARRGVRGSLSGECERKTPSVIIEMRSGNCITKSKRPYLQPPDTRAPPFVLALKNKQKIAEYIRYQLDEEKLGDQMTMFG